MIFNHCSTMIQMDYTIWITGPIMNFDQIYLKEATSTVEVPRGLI